MVFSYSSVKEKINNNEQSIPVTGHFIWPCSRVGAMLLVLPDAACSGLLHSGSHWKPQLGNYLLHIAPAAAWATANKPTAKKYTYFAGRFDGHGYALVRNHAHYPIEAVQGFIRSHWLPALGKY